MWPSVSWPATFRLEVSDIPFAIIIFFIRSPILNHFNYIYLQTFNERFLHSVNYTFPDADTYESLTEPFLIDQISAAMGPIDSQELISQVEQLFSTDDTIENGK